MKTPVFTGAAVAIVTPFKTGGVDFDRLAALCEMHVAAGTDAIVVAGTTGEASTSSPSSSSGSKAGFP
jgi:4-hydroxy-tetrahydrodipicolinate synthase